MIWSQSKKTLLLLFILIVVITVLVVVIYTKDYSGDVRPQIGVTFSKKYAEYLDLDWRAAYIAVLDDLKIRNLRLLVPWDEVEPTFNQYDFETIDWQIREAAKRHARVIVAIGRRTPRWPECHDPKWLSELTTEQIEQEQVVMVEAVVNHLKQFDNIAMWQVENEFYLTTFGECPAMPTALLKQEIARVRSLDARSILITDSGELSWWQRTARLGDKFGHTLYRLVYDKHLGYFEHIFPPAFYRFKAWLSGVELKDLLVAELQAEPWVPEGYTLQLDYLKMKELMNAERLKSHVVFARKTGAQEIYLWGVEWWYWLRVKQNDSELWDTVKNLIYTY